MSDLTALVTKHFPGVPDGEVYPKHHVAGDIVVGDLAKVAIEEKWAEKISGDEPTSAAPAPQAAAVAVAGSAEPGQVQGMTTASIISGADVKPLADGEVVQIPENWKSMKWFALKALAEKIAAREVKDSDDANAVLEAEVIRRAPPA